MLDPVSISTAIAAANTAFKTVQSLVNKGREIEDVMGAMAGWYDAAAQISEAEHQAKNPPLFKKLTNPKSVESMALDSLVAKKKLQEHRKSLREMIMFRWGKEAYLELIEMEKQIRLDRSKAIRAQSEKRKRVLENFLAAVVVFLLIGGSIGTVLLLVFIKG